jgi:hypothetical protein
VAPQTGFSHNAADRAGLEKWLFSVVIALIANSCPFKEK